MFERFRRIHTDPVDPLIAAILEEMETYGPDTNEYDYEKNLAYLERLRKLKAEQRRQPVSPDTKANILGNLAGILIVVLFEKGSVWTSKALDVGRKKP